MKARIVKYGGMYIGEVYGTWGDNFLIGTKWVGWRAVTERCFTRWGAKLQLRKWKKDNEEFEL